MTRLNHFRKLGTSSVQNHGGLLLRRLALPAILLTAAQAQAAVTAFSDKALFLGSTGATVVTAPYYDGGFNSYSGPWGSIVSGGVTFTQVTGGLYMGDATTRLPGGEISINGREEMNLALASPAYAIGFDFVEPEHDPLVNAPFVDSTFTIGLFKGSTAVGSFSFNAPNDSASFAGALSTVAFDRVRIRETVGGIENEFFGQFYASVLPSVPEPSSAALWLVGVAALAWGRRR
jgi:MYXO-CTERM domain-containing protein